MAHTQWQGYGGTGTELYEHGEDGEVPHLELEPRDRARGATAGSSSTPLPDAPAAAAQGARSDAPLRRRRRCPWQEILFSRCARWPFPVSPLRVCVWSLQAVSSKSSLNFGLGWTTKRGPYRIMKSWPTLGQT